MPWTVRYRLPERQRVPADVMDLARQTLKVPPRKNRITSYTDAVRDVIAYSSLSVNGATYRMHDVTPTHWQRKIRAHVVRSRGGEHVKVGELRYRFTERDLDDYKLSLHQTSRQAPPAEVQRFFDHVRREFRHYVTTSRSAELRKLLLHHVTNCRHVRLARGHYRLFVETEAKALAEVVRLVPGAVMELKEEGEQ